MRPRRPAPTRSPAGSTAPPVLGLFLGIGALWPRAVRLSDANSPAASTIFAAVRPRRERPLPIRLHGLCPAKAASAGNALDHDRNIHTGCRSAFPLPAAGRTSTPRRLELPRSVKSMAMISGGNESLDTDGADTFPGAGVCPDTGRVTSSPASAQMFQDRPPPGAASRGSGCPDRASPESGTAVGDRNDPAAADPADHCAGRDATYPAVAPQPRRCRKQGVLSLSRRATARICRSSMAGCMWRITNKPDDTGTFKLIREEHGATPNIVLPPGSYVVHVALGLVSAVRAVSLKAEETDRVGVLPAGGLRIEGRVGSSKIPPNQISFALSKGSQSKAVPAPNASRWCPTSRRRCRAAAGGDLLHHLQLCNANSCVRSDIRVQAGELTDVTVRSGHYNGYDTLKLVSNRGGEALTNTAWSVITPGGDVIKELEQGAPARGAVRGQHRPRCRTKARCSSSLNVVNSISGRGRGRRALARNKCKNNHAKLESSPGCGRIHLQGIPSCC